MLILFLLEKKNMFCLSSRGHRETRVTLPTWSRRNLGFLSIQCGKGVAYHMQAISCHVFLCELDVFLQPIDASRSHSKKWFFKTICVLLNGTLAMSLGWLHLTLKQLGAWLWLGAVLNLIFHGLDRTFFKSLKFPFQNSRTNIWHMTPGVSKTWHTCTSIQNPEKHFVNALWFTIISRKKNTNSCFPRSW